MTEYEAFIRDAAQKRGIDPDIAVEVAKSEGGVDEPARRGTFDTGSSWWPFQLHYGGAGYEYLGTVAGMGNGFTALTGWAPGDPAAWRDSVRYALNRAKAGGWGPWYGAAHVGVDEWDGIDRSVSWDAAAEEWDYEHRDTQEQDPMTDPAPVYDPTTPQQQQDDEWSCSCVTTWWGMTAYGRHPVESWVETQMVADGIVSHEDGLLNATGAPLAAWITEQWGEFGYSAYNNSLVSFDDVRSVAGTSPVLAGGRRWSHWSGVRSYDAASDTLQLANPADGWHGISQTMTRQQFADLGPFSMVVVTWGGTVAPPVQPDNPTYAVGEGLAAKMTEIGDTPASDETFYPLWSEAHGASGARYVYYRQTGEIGVYPP